MTFGSTWNQVQTILRESADLIGIDPNEVCRGDFESGTTITPPGLIIYLEPGDQLIQSEDITIPLCATCTVLCLAGFHSETATRVTEAVELATRVYQIIATNERRLGLGVLWPRKPVRLDTVTADATAAVVQFVLPITIAFTIHDETTEGA